MTKWDLFYESKNGSTSEKLINIIHCINRIKKTKIYDHFNTCRKYIWHNANPLW